MMKSLALVSLVALFLCGNQPAFAGKCYGYSPCGACKNCHYCKHCAENGGSCGVCKGKHAKEQKGRGDEVTHKPVGAVKKKNSSLEFRCIRVYDQKESIRVKLG